MKKLLLASLFSGLALAPMAYADDAHHPDKAASVPAAATPAAKTTERMQENVRRMQTQVDRVAKAKDAKTRDAALAEHLQTMRESMAMGQSMMSAGSGAGMPGMMGGGMAMMGHDKMEHCAQMMGMAPGSAAADVANRMAQMEKRMDMMQSMMQMMAGRGMAPEGMKPEGMKP